MLEEHMDHPNLVHFLRKHKIEDANDLKCESELNELGYFNQTEIGKRFPCKINSIAVGNLFRIVGLAKQFDTVTSPYAEQIPELARFGYGVSGLSIFPIYCWHPEKCIDYINNWLKQKGIHELFYNFEDPTALNHFIVNLQTSIKQDGLLDNYFLKIFSGRNKDEVINVLMESLNKIINIIKDVK